ncbi:hypothetical protein GUJ93_ZPchr0009g711 [Zizania palustris]|uniref:Uncharacterized protein n=1 Tax=Zizania palustris TaxID=103762 RepID=A0A8J5RQ50_ZIZPA|nr:hypothetical protein GUJ93_ZPchr0009g711 [Zizania palustris]
MILLYAYAVGHRKLLLCEIFSHFTPWPSLSFRPSATHKEQRRRGFTRARASSPWQQHASGRRRRRQCIDQ